MFGEDRRWLVVIGSLVGLIVGSGSIKIFAFSILLKPTVEAIGISRSEIGLAFLIGNIFAMACTPIYGRLIDLYGIRVVSVPASFYKMCKQLVARLLRSSRIGAC